MRCSQNYFKNIIFNKISYDLHGCEKCDFGPLSGAVEHLSGLPGGVVGSNTPKARLNIHSIIDFGMVRNAFMHVKFIKNVK